MFKAFGVVFGGLLGLFAFFLLLGVLVAAVDAGEQEDWDWEYYEQKHAYEEWEDNWGGEVYIYETGEVIDTGDVDAAEAIIDMGLGERTMEPPDTDMVKEYYR